MCVAHDSHEANLCIICSDATAIVAARACWNGATRKGRSRWFFTERCTVFYLHAKGARFLKIVLWIGIPQNCPCRMVYLGRKSISSTSTRRADITLTVDGKEVTVPQGEFSFVFPFRDGC